jgi:hypothetical protein
MFTPARASELLYVFSYPHFFDSYHGAILSTDDLLGLAWVALVL